MTSPGIVETLTAKLNPAQKQAVESFDGPLLVLAGAGSGKTRVLTHRVANIIASRKAGPSQVLAVTFTNKAAREMEERIFKILTDLSITVMEPLWVSTFHSFCTRVLKSHITMLDYKPYFSIYDDGDQLTQIKKVLTALKLDEKVYSSKGIRSHINDAKMTGLSPEKAKVQGRFGNNQKYYEIFQMYEEEMKKANALDFGDLLLKVYELFLMYPDILEFYQNKFKYVLVDEYQDTNRIQYLLVRMLASKHRNLCVVGDEDQSIYSWRGADISNILDFEKDFPESSTVKLEENYRSSGNIVKAATTVIKNNLQRKDKTLFTSNSAGSPIYVREEKNEYEEARWVVRKIHAMVAEGEGAYSDYAIFYRTNAQSRVLEELLRTSSIPYQIVGGVRFFERLEIKDVLGYLKLSINPDDDIAFKRVINTPTRGIGKTTVEQIEEHSIQRKLSLYQTAHQLVLERYFNAGTTSKLRGFLDLMEKLQAAAKEMNLLEFYTHVLDSTQYVIKLREDKTPESKTRVQNLEELSNAMSQFMKERDDATLQNFLEEMALVSDIDGMEDDVRKVTMMTMHVSKGLEFPYVFIVGLEENLFPSARGSDNENEEFEMEEERRLAYVGMTRARERLHLTHARTRRVWGQEQMNPRSRFISELPEEVVEFSTAFEVPKFLSRFQQEYGHLGGGAEVEDYQPHHQRRGPDPRLANRNVIRRPAAQDMDSQEFPDYESSEYQKGMKVRHPTFGTGSIFQVEGSGDDQRVSVLFADKTIKKFVAKYARLERV